MISFVDEVLNGTPKYTLTHADSTTEEVYIDLATPITTQGTALNKALFDAIDSFLCPPRYDNYVEWSYKQHTYWLGFM